MECNKLLEAAEECLAAGKISEAMQLFDEAERADADPDTCAGGRWVCHMLAGDFGSAWRESDSIAARGRPDPNRFWSGKPLEGQRVLVRCLHGLGDTLQFVRYVPLLKQCARAVIIEAQPALKRLLQEARLADEVITWGEPEPKWDEQIEIIELPRIFRTTIDAIPSRVPYIEIDNGAPRASECDGDLLRVGLVWASSTYNPARSVPFHLIEQLFNTPGVRFFSLQAGPEYERLKQQSCPVVNLYDESGCVFITATRLAELDLVITVDTMVAHLAGAMGKRVWTLLPFQCDWRWMLKRDDSPWYPTMRLFRQKRPGEWQEVLERVQRDLKRLAMSNSEARPHAMDGKNRPELIPWCGKGEVKA